MTELREPWRAEATTSGGFIIYDNSGIERLRAKDAQTAVRAERCVSACAGLADPAASLAALRAENERMRGVLCAAGPLFDDLRLRVERWEADDPMPDATHVQLWANAGTIREIVDALAEAAP